MLSMQRERNNIFYTDVFTEEQQSSKVTEDVEFMLLSSTSFKSDVKNREWLRKFQLERKRILQKMYFIVVGRIFFLTLFEMEQTLLASLVCNFFLIKLKTSQLLHVLRHIKQLTLFLISMIPTWCQGVLIQHFLGY